MDLTNDIVVTPTSIPVLPPVLINNWSRKVEIETRYRTSVTKTNDAKEVRKGLRVRPSRFVAARLTALERSTIAELTTVMLRLADQNTPIPLYSDVTEVEISTDKGGIYFLGDFSHTRFFPNARLVHFGVYGGKAHGFTIYQMIGATAYYVEVVGPFIASLPGQQLVIPLLDIDIELESLQLRNHTAMVGEYDLNVNERMDESGLPPLIAMAPEVETPAFTEDFEEISVLDPVFWDSSGATIVDGSLEITSFAILKSTVIPSVNDFRVVVTLSEGYTDEFLFRVQTDSVLDDSLDIRLVAGGQQVQARVVTGAVPVVVTLDVVRPPTLLEIMRVNDSVFWYVDGVRVDLSEPPGFGTSVPIEKILLDNTIGAGTIKIDAVTLYATATEYVQNVFDPETFLDVPILDISHNWKDSFNLDISRIGLRAPLGRGRIVTIDSERPQFEFHIQALLDRAELFDLLIFFEWARGRLAQFWFINKVTMWEVVSIIGNEITINKDTPDASDISSFFPYISLINPDGTHEMAVVDTVDDQTTTLKISTLTSLSGTPFIYLTSAHLVRFSADSIREVWNSRDICDVSFKVMELLESLQGVGLSIFGGFPNTNPANSIFGGDPDQCYLDEDKGYFGGNAVPPNALVPVNVCSSRLATGGIKTTFGLYTIHAFLTAGDFTIVSDITEIDVLVISGAGGGGRSTTSAGGAGGGGAGGYIRDETHAVVNGVYPAVVGDGGSPGISFGDPGTTGADSSFDGIVPSGGGRGAGYTQGGGNGGSGGGEGSAGNPPGLGVPGEGFDGGDKVFPFGGAGGGAGEVGGTTPNTGGDGLDFSASFGTGYGDTNFPGWFGGGGHPGKHTSLPNDGGKGGGADSDPGTPEDGGSGQANTGGGGGGGYGTGSAGSGGSGIVLIRYLT